MLRLNPLRLNLLRAAIVAVVALAFLTGQSGPPQPLPLFGVSADTLAKDGGISAYPPDGSPTISAAAAMDAAREGYRTEDRIAGTQLVHLKNAGVPFDGLAWAVAWDVEGQPAKWPGDSQLPPDIVFVYTFDITFIDARTGHYVTGLAESRPLPPAPTDLR